MVTVLKQDRQAFGSLLSKSVSLEEAFKYPVTSLPLSIATGEVELRQSGKRNNNDVVGACVCLRHRQASESMVHEDRSSEIC